MIVCGDLDSAELRVNAYIAKDKPMLDILAVKGKPHLDTAYHLFGKRISKSDNPEEYKFAKSFYYQWIYTLPDKIPRDTGKLRLYTVELSGEQLALMTKKLDKAHPAIVIDKKMAIAELHKTHKVRNLFGRYRDLSWGLRVWSKEIVEHCEQAALNFRVQTVIGKIINRAIIRLDKMVTESNLPIKLVLQCHDELALEIDDPGLVDKCVAMLHACIEQPIPEMSNMIIPAEIKVGPNWGQVKAI